MSRRFVLTAGRGHPHGLVHLAAGRAARFDSRRPSVDAEQTIQPRCSAKRWQCSSVAIQHHHAALPRRTSLRCHRHAPRDHVHSTPAAACLSQPLICLRWQCSSPPPAHGLAGLGAPAAPGPCWLAAFAFVDGRFNWRIGQYNMLAVEFYRSTRCPAPAAAPAGAGARSRDSGDAGPRRCATGVVIHLACTAAGGWRCAVARAARVASTLPPAIVAGALAFAVLLPYVSRCCASWRRQPVHAAHGTGYYLSPADIADFFAQPGAPCMGDWVARQAAALNAP